MCLEGGVASDFSPLSHWFMGVACLPFDVVLSQWRGIFLFPLFSLILYFSDSGALGF